MELLERVVDFTDRPRRFIREDGSFDILRAVREWRALRREIISALMEDPS